MKYFTVQTVVNSVYSSNSYILTHALSEGVEAWIIDVGDSEKILRALPPRVSVRGIFLTHTHYDHIYGLNSLLSVWPEVPLYTNAAGKRALMSPRLNYSRYHLEASDFVLCMPENVSILDDGMLIELFDNIILKVVATPGHDASCLTYIVDNYVFSGDSFIPGICTKATFLQSDKSMVKGSEHAINDLATGKTLCPGHGPIYFEYNR